MRGWTKKQAATLAARLKGAGLAETPTPKRKKYGNNTVEQGGQKFDSRLEFRRYTDLALMERAGQISDLRRQVQFELIPAQRRADGTLERACHYVADAVYIANGVLVVEDTKSVATRRERSYIIKRKLMLHIHGITIREVE